MTLRAMKLARADHCAIIYDVDDLLFDESAVDHLSQFGTAGSSKEAVDRYRSAMKMADLVTCSTDYLKDRIKEFHPHCVVMRNGLSQTLLNVAKNVKNSMGAEHTSVTMAYFSGSGHHDADFSIVQPALLKLLETHPETRLLLVGKLRFDEQFRKFGDRFEYHSFVPYAEFMPMPGQADINLVPLDQSDPFAQARSELKYIEAGVFGVPTVASPTLTYAQAIQHGHNGLLSADDDWYDTLSGVIRDAAMRKKLGQRASEDVQHNFGPEMRAAQWDELIRQLPDDPSLTRTSLMPALIKGRQALEIWKRALKRYIKS
ncbi:glycosyltransferase family 4 protein [Sulfitobacter sp.]|uniref:glycosyltransferase family 4 protein n=1 Tax=Sulfitobacter sp. TaxID=1903071 RepID=UPI00356212BF